MKRIAALMLALISLMGIFAACGKKNKPTLAGDWVLASVSLGEDVELFEYNPDAGITPPQVLIRADGSFILQNSFGTVRGTWEPVKKSKTDYTFTFGDEAPDTNSDDSDSSDDGDDGEKAVTRKCTWENGENTFSWLDDEGYLYVYNRLVEEEPVEGSSSEDGSSSDSSTDMG